MKPRLPILFLGLLVMATCQDPPEDPAALDPPPERPAPAADTEEGPVIVGEDIERPRRLGKSGTIEGLVAMMQSGEYVWGVCIFQVTISEMGEVGDVVFLQPEHLAPEVEHAITEGVRTWRFSPATRDGEAVAVYYNLLIHHCPFQKKDSEE